MSSITTLQELIAQVESNNEQFAFRFEPSHRPNSQFVSKLANLIGCSYMSAETLCASSFGLYQIMGDELVALGLSISPIQYCASEPMQNFYFQKYITVNGLSYATSMPLKDFMADSAKLLAFATRYNGPGNSQGYVNRMLSVYKGAI
jgi:hypothetical protein